MKDFEDLLNVDTSEFKENEEEELKEDIERIKASEPPEIDIELEGFNPRAKLTDAEENRLREKFKSMVSSITKFEAGACQAEDDGDLVCQFKLHSPMEVSFSKRHQTLEVPTFFEEGKIILKDFDEVSINGINKLFPKEEEGLLVVR